MKKKAALFHGLGGSKTSYWIPWLKTSLEADGFHVWAPSLSGCSSFEDLDKWVQEIVATSPPTHRDYDLMVGHSAGGSLILRLLSRSDFTVKHAISVAGFIKPIPDNKLNNMTFPVVFDIGAIQKNCNAFTFIHSDNDPWSCGQEQGELMRQNLGGTLVVMSGEGHFGSDHMKQPYDTFPLLLKLCMLNIETGEKQSLPNC
ncbi:Predicted esterase of the alpha/beta hydrolase fold [Nitrosomonas aestuarii]|uniref:Predicted esterase of the alpha/beta hydrolase fold n=1 Tax=Nitrosomonas aestuarii TaxID=52441 RepID=A0A1I4FRZ9_9PROT|nr:alpha/beta fold hydrolase [Nitrosomonas aestuarii]SFL20060.1 Predicted esterase of the alpha/beta hydrolase fold [Nitrosomonas aestuarii]